MLGLKVDGSPVTRRAKVTVSPGADEMLNMRRVPLASGWRCGTLTSMYCPGVKVTGFAGRNVNSHVVGVSCRFDSSVSRMPRRCPKKNATRFPTTRASCGVE